MVSSGFFEEFNLQHRTYPEEGADTLPLIMELGPKRPSPLWFWGPISILVVWMDPSGVIK